MVHPSECSRWAELRACRGEGGGGRGEGGERGGGGGGGGGREGEEGEEGDKRGGGEKGEREEGEEGEEGEDNELGCEECRGGFRPRLLNLNTCLFEHVFRLCPFEQGVLSQLR